MPTARRKSFITFLIVPIVVLLGLTSFGVAAASPAGTLAAAHPNAKKPKIIIDHFAFQDSKPVRPGRTIIVTNNDCCTHTVTSDDGSSFHLRLHPHTTKTFQAPMTPGTYTFHCAIHPEMKGELIVKDR
jgi:plastocyanin